MESNEIPVKISQSWRGKTPVVSSKQTHFDLMKPVSRNVWFEYIKKGWLPVNSDVRKWLDLNGFENIKKEIGGGVDLRTCKEGDILISSQGAILEYISPTPWKHYTYLDHVVRYVEDRDGNSFGKNNYGTRTYDGFTYAENRIPETDHDIIKIISK